MCIRDRTITAYYQHQTPLSVPPSLSTSQVPSVVRVPTVRFVTLEESAPMPEPPMYDVPRSPHEELSYLLPTSYRPRCSVRG